MSRIENLLSYLNRISIILKIIVKIRNEGPTNRLNLKLNNSFNEFMIEVIRTFDEEISNHNKSHIKAVHSLFGCYTKVSGA
jgi:hypothetical protein